MSAVAAISDRQSGDDGFRGAGARPSPLLGHRQRLNGTTAEVEQIFLGIGERLVTCVGILGDMQSAFGAVTTAHDSPELASAETAIRALVGECLGLVERLQHERSLIERLSRALAAAAPRIDELRQTVAMIAAIAINARVTAAGMRDHGNSGLTVFTDDVLELSKRASAVVDELQQGQVRLRKLLGDASTRSETFERNFRTATQTLKERTEANLRGAVAERIQAGKVGSSATSVSQEIAQEVATIVASMQIGDNTRQRLEHVTAALAIAGDHAAARPAIMRLQLAQLADSRDHLVSETSYIRDAILVLSRRIDRSFTALKGELAKAGGADQPGAQRLASDVCEAAAELSQSEAEHAHVDALAQTIGGDVELFRACSDEMRTLEFEMRLVSLNTAITCSNLGREGKALGVVSLQMRELVGEMVTRSEAVAGALSELGTIAAELSEVRSVSAERSMATLVAEAERSLVLLQTVDGRLETVGTVLSELGERVAMLTFDAGAALGRLDGLVDDLSEVEADLAMVAGDEAEGLDAPSQDHAALFAELRAAYTMEAERQVHDAVLGGDGRPAAEAAGIDDGAVDIDAMLF
ncbi:hypothetical protein [Jiella avicenniae]|uniref:Methyl-accepting chemotaxis protein n=1 Tax=Jiella avicenniae TaxID=2907202 RepID=A0A9X1P3J0_9HYPH|nr:hypothetical protein [Jiella avicenniae]MCE7028611.1 hypothetical protein [Jiella avicenniae]